VLRAEEIANLRERAQNPSRRQTQRQKGGQNWSLFFSPISSSSSALDRTGLEQSRPGAAEPASYVREHWSVDRPTSSGTWYQDTRQSVDAAAEWAFSRLERFSPFDESDCYDPSRVKAFVEFSVMLATYLKLTRHPQRADNWPVVELVPSVCKRADFTDRIMRSPEMLVGFAELCGVLQELGFADLELRRRIQSAVDAGLVEHIERLPYRLLEVRLSLDWAGVVHSLPPMGELISETILGRPLCTPWLSREAIYAVTHVVMFVARFGLRKWSSPPPALITRTRAVLCDLMVIACQDNEWDLLGELLLCWDCLDFEPTSLTAAAWVSFLSARQDDGAFLPRRSEPGGVTETNPKDGSTSNQPVGGRASKADDFGLVYHTTLVAILAGTVRIHRTDLNVV
jgi:hypothetical protein